MIWARFETRHFTFDVFASNRGKAWGLLARAWNRHANLTGAEPDYFLKYQDDVQYMEVRTGKVLMDREPFEIS